MLLIGISHIHGSALEPHGLLADNPGQVPGFPAELDQTSVALKPGFHKALRWQALAQA